jgi:hypothetical protein
MVFLDNDYNVIIDVSDYSFYEALLDWKYSDDKFTSTRNEVFKEYGISKDGKQVDFVFVVMGSS